MEIYIYKNGFFDKWYRKADKRSRTKALAMIEKIQNGGMNWIQPIKGNNITGLMETKTRTGERIFWGRDRKNNRLLILGGCTKRDQKQAINRVKKNLEKV